MKNNIPIYSATITDITDGIYKISLVDLPAVECNWVAFDKEKEYVNYSVQDEEQRIIYGVIMRADFPIYRRKGDFEYYITYSKDTIKTMAEKLMVDGYQNRINLMHTEGTDVAGVNLLQLFIKDTENGINPVGFEDVEDGSLFAQYKVENDAVWEMIKNGTFQGFSLEGYFTFEEKMEKNNQNNKKTTLMSIKDLFQRMLIQFAAVETDKGTIVWEGDDELKEGTIVTLENGEQPENGQYETEDGKIITIEDGKVTKIEDKEAEVAPEPEPEAKPEEMAEPEAEPAQDPEPEPEPEYDAKAEIEALRAEIEALKAEMESLKAQFADFVEKPVVEPVVEEFSKVTEFNTGNTKLDKVCKRMQALRK